MPFPNERTYSFDAGLQLADGAAPYTLTGFSTVGAQNVAIDLQANQGASPQQLARVDAVAVCDVTALTVSSNQTYKLMVLVSNDIGFGPGNVEQAGEIMLGVGTSRDGPGAGGGSMITSPTGRYEIMFSNQVAGKLYQYAALFLVLAGTSPSISLDAFIAVLPEM